jgi:hypothetical protein
MPFRPARRSASRAARAPLTALAVILVAHAPPPLLAQPAATSPTTHAADREALDDVNALIAQLGGADWAARDAAQRRLAALDRLAEPALRRVLADGAHDAEVRTRAEAALAQIEENRHSGPTMITLRLRDVEPRVAFEELSRQAGVTLRPQPPSLWSRNLPRVTIEPRGEPFWDVAERLRAQCGLDVEPYDAAALAVLPSLHGRAAQAAPTVTHGPFRVRASRVTRSYAVDLAAGGTRAAECFVLLTIHAEPKLRISGGGGSGRVKLEAAEDENGLSLLPEETPVPLRRARQAIEYGPATGALQWTVRVPLAYPETGAGERLARLKGSTSVRLVARADTMEVADVLTAGNVTREVGGARVTFMGCHKVGGQYEVALTLPRDGKSPAGLLALRGSGAHDTVRLFDAQGREYQRSGGATTIASDAVKISVYYSAAAAPALPGAAGLGGAVQAAARLAPPPPPGLPAKLLWQVPTEVRDLDIPFQFTDLPLP